MSYLSKIYDGHIHNKLNTRILVSHGTSKANINDIQQIGV